MRNFQILAHPQSENKKMNNNNVYKQWNKLKLLYLTLSNLECNNDEADKDVHHEEGNNHNEADVEDGHPSTVVVFGSMTWSIRVNGHVQQTEKLLLLYPVHNY